MAQSLLRRVIGAPRRSLRALLVPAALLATAPDAAASVWARTGNDMAVARYGHTMTLLADGRVVAAGGYDGTQVVATADIFDPATGMWSPTGAMTAPAMATRRRCWPTGACW